MRDNALREAVGYAAQAIEIYGDPVVKWTRVTLPNDRSNGFGFLELSSVAVAGALIKLAEDEKLGLKVVPDMTLASRCLEAVKAFEIQMSLYASLESKEKSTGGQDDQADGEGAAKDPKESTFKDMDKLRKLIRTTLSEGKPNDTSNARGEGEEFDMEERIKQINRLEPRAPDVSDYLWETLTQFRHDQAKREIENDDRRKAAIEEALNQKRREIAADEEKQKREIAAPNDGHDEGTASASVAGAPSDPAQAANPGKTDTLELVFQKKHKPEGSQNGETAAKKRKVVPDAFSEEEKKEELAKQQSKMEILKDFDKAAKLDEAKALISKRVEQHLGECDLFMVGLVLDEVKKEGAYGNTPVEKIAQIVAPILVEDAIIFAQDVIDDLKANISTD